MADRPSSENPHPGGDEAHRESADDARGEDLPGLKRVDDAEGLRVIRQMKMNLRPRFRPGGPGAGGSMPESESITPQDIARIDTDEIEAGSDEEE